MLFLISIMCLMLSLPDAKYMGKSNKAELEKMMNEMDDNLSALGSERGKGRHIAKKLFMASQIMYWIGITTGIIQIAINILSYLIYNGYITP